MIQLLIRDIADKLQKKFRDEEARILSRELLSYVLNIREMMLFTLQDVELTEEERELLEDGIRRLLEDEPIQYIVGKTEFYRREYLVNSNVLIPRPETEELVEWVVSDSQSSMGNGQFSILDIGTGSGCIAISLANELLGAQVRAFDISHEALEVAEMNSIRHGAGVDFVHQDILTAKPEGGQYDVIVSNPPYIMEKEREGMESNVLEYEPEMALFVPDDDPLKFYRAIAEFALVALKSEGRLYFEINSACGEDMKYMLLTLGFKAVELRKDMFGNERMIRATIQ